jgi:hypothetical protein
MRGQSSGAAEQIDAMVEADYETNL